MEGWAESLSYELNQFGIGIKNIEPGLVATGGNERPEFPAHPAYSTPKEIEDVVYEAATDGKETLRYVCGEDAKALYAQGLTVW